MSVTSLGCRHVLFPLEAYISARGRRSGIFAKFEEAYDGNRPRILGLQTFSRLKVAKALVKSLVNERLD